MTEKIDKIVKELKKSIEYRAEHKKLIDEFLRQVRHFFIEKYDIYVRTPTFVDSFGVELDPNCHYLNKRPHDFMQINMLADFCQTFGCEFEHTACDGTRYIFTYTDVDMSHAFFGW